MKMNKFKVGDRVKATVHGNEYKGTVIEVNSGGCHDKYLCRFKGLDGHNGNGKTLSGKNFKTKDYWYLYEEALEPLNEFKVGDRVRIRQWDDMKKEFGIDRMGDIKCECCFTKRMKYLCGKVAKIEDVCDKRVELEIEGGHWSAWNFSTDMIEPLKGETIVIYRKGNEVVALDKVTGEKATARCCPEDEFDFRVGAKLAFERLTKEERIEDWKTVEVTDHGYTYSTYSHWTGLKGYESHYVNGKIPKNEKEYKLLRIANHDMYGADRKLALIQDPDTTQVFIICVDGIKKAGK